jgi:glycerophosphoryl diester phosphodiesterase
MKSPQIIAHRGDVHRHPENSLAAFSSALDGGVRLVELDLQINASGSLVILHDPDFQRTHRVELSAFDHVDGQEPQVPTVWDVLKLANRYPDAKLFLEIKHDSIDHWGQGFVLDKLSPLAKAIGDHVLLASSADFLAQARSIGFPAVGLILRDWSEAAKQRAAALSPDYLVINIRRVPDGEQLWSGAWKWAVYEVADVSTADAWGNRGADLVISMNPVDLLQQQRTHSGD